MTSKYVVYFAGADKPVKIAFIQAKSKEDAIRKVWRSLSKDMKMQLGGINALDAKKLPLESLTIEEFDRRMKKLGIGYHWSEGFGALWGKKCPICGKKGLVAMRGRALLRGRKIGQINYCPECGIVWAS